MEFIQTNIALFFGILPALSLLFLRIILSIMFIDSGRRHLMTPTGRAEQLELSRPLIIVIGLVNTIGGMLILVGLLTQIAAFFLSGVMVGAILIKMFIWKTGIYGIGNCGWYYDALLLAGTGVLFAYGAGEFALDAIL